MYIADSFNNRIRKVTVSTGIITTIAGTGTSSYSGDNGPATNAALYKPHYVALDSLGNSLCWIYFLFIFFSLHRYPLDNVYIADSYNHCVRKVTVSTGIITTLAGTGSNSYSGDNGASTAATLYEPWGIILDSEGKS